MNLIQDLEWRGLIYQSTDRDALQRRLAQQSITLYSGFDPTADSLHIGHLLPILTLRRFQLHGHRPIALVGGGTGLIGDPSGKREERRLNEVEIVEEWTEKLKGQLSRFLDVDRKENRAQIVNNYDWLSKLRIIEFLREIGKHFSLNTMLAKESVSARLEKGISFTEFSYMVLQSYDFFELHRRYHCELQIGGSDQWGNMTSGVELIRKCLSEAKSVHVLTLPLVTKSDGQKFGKTEGGAIWLDEKKTSSYKFYQFWLNADDRDVVKLLKFFTFLTREEIESLEQTVKTEPEKRIAQRRLADEVTRLVHGEESVKRAERISQILFSGNVRELTAEEIAEGFGDVPSIQIQDQEIGVVDVLVQVGAAKSKREAREFLSNGAIRINDERHQETTSRISEFTPLDGKYYVIRRGKRNYYLVEKI